MKRRSFIKALGATVVATSVGSLVAHSEGFKYSPKDVSISIGGVTLKHWSGKLPQSTLNPVWIDEKPGEENEFDPYKD